MQVGGKTSIVRNSAAIELKAGGDSVTLTLTAVPLGWRDRIQKIKTFEIPEAPREPLKNSSGKIVKGEDGLALVVRNDGDPAYVAKLAKIGLRLKTLKVYELLRNDPQVKFDAKEPEGDEDAEWSMFCDEIIEELKAFGITEEELNIIEAVGDKLSTRIDMEQLKKHFLPYQAE